MKRWTALGLIVLVTLGFFPVMASSAESSAVTAASVVSGTAAPKPVAPVVAKPTPWVAGAKDVDYVAPGTQAAIDKGLAFLKKAQSGNGGWGSDIGDAAPNEGATAITLLGLVRSGVPDTDPMVDHGLKYLLGNVKEDGGIHGKGTVFAVNADGTGFTTLHSFNGGKDGANPQGALILSSNTLYGTARAGGLDSEGTVFSLSFRPQLTIIPSETNLILTWPTNYAGFDYTGYTLESTTNLVSPVWATNSPAPVVVNGQNVVTNSITGSQQFYRLIQ